MPAIQLTRARTVGAGARDAIAELGARFAAAHCVTLPQLVESEILAFVQRGLDEAAFVERRDESDAGHDIARELTLVDGPVVNLLQLLANDPAFFDVIRAITGCGAIRLFDGRVYRLPPGGAYFDSWHDDIADRRMIGMSVNLGAAPYAGGVFQIRAVGGPTLAELPNTGPGDAILFRIDDALQHQVTPVTGDVAKTAFAGWFRG